MRASADQVANVWAFLFSGRSSVIVAISPSTSKRRPASLNEASSALPPR